jgi:hypothetical protein
VERSFEKGRHERRSDTASATKGSAAPSEKSHDPMAGPARPSVPNSVLVKTPFAESKDSVTTKSGIIAWALE